MEHYIALVTSHVSRVTCVAPADDDARAAGEVQLDGGAVLGLVLDDEGDPVPGHLLVHQHAARAPHLRRGGVALHRAPAQPQQCFELGFFAFDIHPLRIL